MKKSLQIIVFLVIGLLFSACGQIPTEVRSPIPPNTATATADLSIEFWIETSLADTPTATATLNPTAPATLPITPTKAYVPPTLIPTIDPTLLPDLLRKTLSIRTTEGVNGHKIRQITGWNYGFGRGTEYGSCAGYSWLNTSHIVLYPEAGQQVEFYGDGATTARGRAPQPVVMNVDNGILWLPPVESGSCQHVNWSPELGILINSEVHNDTPTVSIYTYDGRKLTSYPGSLTDISQSREKILVGENTVIDLRTGKKTTLAWSLKDYNELILSELFWTAAETRIYRCCYFYADLNAGTSFRFGSSGFQDRNGNQFDYEGLWMYRGQWVRNDAFFLTQWSWIDDGDIRYLPLFDPATKLFYDVRELAGISEDLTCQETNVSTRGSYIWLECYEKNYLINLTTFEANEYLIPGYSNADIDWSMDEKFALIQNYNYSSEITQYYLLSLSNKEFNPLPIVNPVSIPWQHPWWHPTDGVFAYIEKDGQTFELFDAQTMTTQTITLPATFRDFVWSPAGERIALIEEDGSIWQMDYPNLEHSEQLTPPLSNVHNVNWSPDGNSIAFISGSDIYIVETNK